MIAMTQIPGAAVAGQSATVSSRDPRTGAAPADTRADHLDTLDDPPIPVTTGGKPLEVVIVRGQREEAAPRLVTNQVYIASGDTQQIIGRSPVRDKVTLRVETEFPATRLYIGPDQNKLDARGFRLDDTDGFTIDSSASIYGYAQGGYVRVYILTQEYEK